MKRESAAIAAYRKCLDATLKLRYGIDTADAGIDHDEIAAAHASGELPEDFVGEFALRYGLDETSDGWSGGSFSSWPPRQHYRRGTC